jgi:hypothetical protein
MPNDPKITEEKESTQDTLPFGPKSNKSSFLSWMTGSRNKIYKVEISDEEIYEGRLLDGRFHGRGKLRYSPMHSCNDDI